MSVAGDNLNLLREGNKDEQARRLLKSEIP
jgi:hypothetical protein